MTRQRMVKLRFHCEPDVRDEFEDGATLWVRQYNGHRGLEWRIVDSVTRATRFSESAAVAFALRVEDSDRLLEGDRLEVVHDTWDELPLEVDDCFLVRP